MRRAKKKFSDHGRNCPDTAVCLWTHAQLRDGTRQSIVVADSGSENIKRDVDDLLDSFAALHRLIEFYVVGRNRVMPHSAFDGQTPNEMDSETGDEVAFEIAIVRRRAREDRMKANRAARCGACPRQMDSGALLLRRPRSRMSSDAAGIMIVLQRGNRR